MEEVIPLKFNSITAWIKHHLPEKGDSWCYKNLEQCAIDCEIESINPESFSRLIRKERGILYTESIPLDSDEVATIAGSIGYHDIDMTKFNITKAYVNTYGSETNKNKQVKLELKPIDKSGLSTADIITEFRDEISKYKPKVLKLKREKLTDPYMMEIALPDLHASLLAWKQETADHDYDLNIFQDVLKSSVDKHLRYIYDKSIDKIILSLNGDIFNSDTINSTTTKGTHQDDDGRFQKSFSVVWKSLRDVAIYCSNYADVEIIMTSGNHDTQKVYYLGEVLKAWFDGDPHITVDNRPMLYKYIQYGNSLLGITHGHNVKMDRMPGIMATDAYQLWGATKYREVHMGHLHSETSREYPGCTVRICKAMSPASAWSIDAGYRSIPMSQSFLWNKQEGVVANFYVKSF